VTNVSQEQNKKNRRGLRLTFMRNGEWGIWESDKDITNRIHNTHKHI